MPTGIIVNIASIDGIEYKRLNYVTLTV